MQEHIINDMTTHMFWLSWLTLVLLADNSFSAKILGGSAVGGSHYIMIRNVMEEVASRGHEVSHNNNIFIC